ncbi:helix-turn-helix domain-containing protein [Enterococcus larvae]|uniref:helix-turn-helix domain-containing protein n=1 Tax=Enterococcus larvae TaxID=2794352 RepID=UPI003F2AF5C2
MEHLLKIIYHQCSKNANGFSAFSTKKTFLFGSIAFLELFEYNKANTDKKGGEKLSLFSDKLSYLMKTRDMNDDELGSIVGVNRTTVTRWRTGERSPKMEKLPEIAAVFQVDPRIFVGEADDSEDILSIYSQLESSRKEYVYTVAKNQLEEQSKIVSIRENQFNDLAAHSPDPNKKYSAEKIDEINQRLKEAKNKHK